MDSLYNRYALALFYLAFEKKRVKEYQNEVRVVYESFKKNEEVVHTLSSCFLSKEEKMKIVDNILVDCEEKDVEYFVKVLINNGRQIHILKIFEEFDKICDEHSGVKTGIVYSPFKIDETQIIEIEKVIGTKIGFTVKLTNEIDAKLIGGVKVVIGDHVFDNSIQNKLQKMRTTLIKGGN